MDTSKISFHITEKHIDILKHVNYQVYISHFEKARFDWFQQNDMSFHDLLDRGLTFVLKNLNTTYIKESRLGDSHHLETKLGKLGRTSFTMTQTMYNQNNEQIALSDSTMVMFDMKTRHSIEVIPEIAQHFNNKK